VDGEVAVKALRIAQLVVVVLLAVYLWVFHTINQDYVQLPLVPSMRPALVVLLAAVIAYLVGWIPAQMRAWRLQRKLKAVTEERDGLVADLEISGRQTGMAEPVIPDRIDPYETGSDARRRGDDPTDYL
jgi:uncharacterized integral membrane protein